MGKERYGAGEVLSIFERMSLFLFFRKSLHNLHYETNENQNQYLDFPIETLVFLKKGNPTQKTICAPKIKNPTSGSDTRHLMSHQKIFEDVPTQSEN